jgi:L-ribulose-5-phosphate 3-epimerase
MRTLEALEIGVMFWTSENPAETLAQVKKFGVNAGQIGFPGELLLEGLAEKWRELLEENDFTVATAVCSYIGESYADIPTVQRTVGLVPQGTRKERLLRTKEVANFAASLGIPSVGCHIGFVPHLPSDPLYHEIRDATRELCDHCGSHAQSFALETGQESAEVLLDFIGSVNRPNLRINFDPANLILYGTGEPLPALDVLSPKIISVHCKDGVPPQANQPEALGVEQPLGQGSVGIPAFIAKLKEIGYTGILSVEREEADPEKRTQDIHHAIALLRQLTTGKGASS